MLLGNVITCTLCETILTRFDESIVDPTNEQAATIWKTMNRKAVI